MRGTRALAVVVLCLLFQAAAHAQGTKPQQPSQPQFQGITLQVHVMLTAPGQLPEHVRVQLQTTSGIPVTEQFLRGTMAEFQRLQAGAYHVIVTGDGLEPVPPQRVELLSFQTRTTLQVMVSLVATEATRTGGTQPVAVADLKIPAKARREFDRGMRALERQQNEQAKRHFHKATELYPEYAAAYNNLAVLAIRERDLPRGRELFEQALSLNPDLQDALVNLARIEQLEGRFGESEVLLLKAAAQGPDEAATFFLLTYAQAQLGKWDEAVANAQRTHQFPHERLAEVHLVAARILERQGKPAAAAAEYKLFLTEDPQHAQAPAVREAVERITAAAKAP